jgi:hypothetical protein
MPRGGRGGARPGAGRKPGATRKKGKTALRRSGSDLQHEDVKRAKLSNIAETFRDQQRVHASTHAAVCIHCDCVQAATPAGALSTSSQV